MRLTLVKILLNLGLIDRDFNLTFDLRTFTKPSVLYVFSQTHHWLSNHPIYVGCIESSRMEWANSRNNSWNSSLSYTPLLCDCFMVRPLWVCQWKKPFWGWGGVGRPAYLLFGAVYWSRQPMVFRRLTSLLFCYLHPSSPLYSGCEAMAGSNGIHCFLFCKLFGA